MQKEKIKRIREKAVSNLCNGVLCFSSWIDIMKFVSSTLQVKWVEQSVDFYRSIII